jgi:hypothetical protein
VPDNDNAVAYSDMLGFALLYAQRGWRVFPCHTVVNGRCTCRDSLTCSNPGKHPIFDGGFRNATAVPDQLRQQFRRLRSANIGLAPGPSGLIVVDLDYGATGEYQSGVDTWARERGLFREPTLTARTGKGIHLYFATPRESNVALDANPAELGGHVTIRHHNGYVIIPPSLHISGRHYEWVDESILPIELPDLATAWLLEDRARRATSQAPTLGDSIPLGDRNPTLTSLAGSMRARGMTATEMEAALLVVNRERCEPPLDDDEVRGIAESVSRYPPGNARTASVDAVQEAMIEGLAAQLQRGPVDVPGTVGIELPARIGPAAIQPAASFPNPYSHLLDAVHALGSNPTTDQLSTLGLLLRDHVVFIPTIDRWAVRTVHGKWELLKHGTYLRALNVKVSLSGDRPVSVAKWYDDMWRWRRVVTGFDTVATGDVPEHIINRWAGLAYPPVAGDWSMIQAHMRDILCNHDDDLYAHLLWWFATAIAEPDRRIDHAVLLVGKQGTGKSLIAEGLARIFGTAHALQVANHEQVVGRFSGHLDGMLLVVIDEAKWNNDRHAASTFKSMITSEHILIEHKGVTPVQQKNRLKFILTSNDEANAIPASAGDERRYFVLDVNEERRGDRDYFTELYRQLTDSNVLSAMHFDLLAYAREHGRVIPPPTTDALRAQTTRNLPHYIQWLVDCVSDGVLIPSADTYTTQIVASWPREPVRSDALYHAFLDYCARRAIPPYGRDSRDVVFREINKRFPGLFSRGRARFDGEQLYTYTVLPLEQTRALLARELGLTWLLDVDETPPPF